MVDVKVFMKWSISRQAQYTWKFGDHLAKKDGFQFNHDLYILGGFFVEIVYNLELGQVESVYGFNQSSYLLPYVEEIDLAYLFT